MYRDQREAVRQRLLSVEAENEDLEERLRVVGAEVARREKWGKQLRRLRWSLPVTIVSCIGFVLVVAAATHGTDERRRASREARRLELTREKAHLQQSVDQRRRAADALLARLREPLPHDPEAVRIFGELRYHDGSSVSDAWVVVGGTACALGDGELAQRAAAALESREDRRPQHSMLAELCGSRISP